MKAKLQHLIKSEGLTASRFAEMLEIQPAGVSHILAGRNKPSFDLLQKILRRFPKINPDWLLLDSDKMYREGWDGTGNLTDASGANGSLGGDNNFGASRGVGSSNFPNSGMPAGSLFGGANGAPNGGGSNMSGDSRFSNGMTGSNGQAGSLFANGEATRSNGGVNSGVGNLGGPNTNSSVGTRNLSLGESHISGMQGIGAGLSQSRAGQPIQKIVIFYADGTFEAYSHGF